MGNKKALKVRTITLYYQTAAETGGNPGWAYNVVDADGEHTSYGFSVTDCDDGSESFSDVRAAFAAEWPAAAAQVSSWQTMPEGGWRGTR